MFFSALKHLLKVKVTNYTKPNFKNQKKYNNGNFRNMCSKCQGTETEKCKEKVLLMDLNCKTAVITGGTGGIGFATAHQLLCGKAKVVALVGLDCCAGLEAVNTLNCSYGKDKAIFVKCNVKNKEEFEEVLLKLKTDYKKIDILVNTAGIWDDVKWEEELSNNLVGTINTTLAALKYINKGNGIIVNLAGIAGVQPFPPSPMLSAAHAAVIRFSQNFGHDMNFRKTGIRVIVLCPGITNTDFSKNAEKRTFTPEMGKDLEVFLKAAHRQKPEACAKSVVELIQYGPSGSTWIIEGSRLFYLDYPDPKNYCHLVSQYT